MPTYEYRCNACRYVFEQFQSMTEKPLTACPTCNGPVTRLIGSGLAILVKGSNAPARDLPQTHAPACGRERPCCGRDTPCDNKPCAR